MAQIRGTAGYNLGSQDRFGGAAGRADATNDPSPLEQIREQTSKIEEWLDNAADPIKPYVCSTVPPCVPLVVVRGTERDNHAIYWVCLLGEETRRI